jgi:ATP-dependent helicase Lhr and Lhr-like helicase
MKRASSVNVLARLHPALNSWFAARFPSPTEVQARALPHTLAGRNTLILAPTGSGKTLAAFLSVLSELGRRAAAGRLPNAICAVYVSPLKSLDRDIHRNLEAPLAAINASLPPEWRIRMEVRTGDTEAKQRARQMRQRPHLLLTTPESLAALLSQKGYMDGFDPFTLVIDEIHSFAEGKRGTLLALTVERLEAKATHRLQRVGLSATAWPLEEVSRLLCGRRDCEIVESDIRKTHRLDVAVPPADLDLPAAGYNPYRIASTVAGLVEKARCSLVFLATRSGAERMALALKILLPDLDELIAVHHSSIELSERLAIEEGLSKGTYRAVVASTSLELGVDFQAVDQVLLVGTPLGVSRALQRLGRSGHRIDGVASGSLVPLSLPDAVRGIALRRAAAEGRLDALRVPHAPLDVLAQALLGMSIEREWGLDEAFERVRQAGPYLDLPRTDFDDIVTYLAGGGRVLGPYGTYGKIVVENGRFHVASRTVARDYYMNIGTISDDFQVKVVTRAQRRLGEVEESFLGMLRQGDAFVIGGRAVVLDRMQGNTAVVKPATGERVLTPRWMGPKMPLTARLAEEELMLRRDLRDAWEAGGERRCRRMLAKQWNAPEAATDRVIEFVVRQLNAAPIPVNDPVQVERVREGRTQLILFHVVAGRAVNRSLAWVLGQRMGVGGSVVANHDDHAFLVSVALRDSPPIESLREAFHPDGWREDLLRVLESTETMARRFRTVAEIGHLLPKRTFRGPRPARQSSWNGSLLYATLREHEPDHPLLRESVREVMEDLMDVERAYAEARRIYEADWEVFDLPRPSPFGLPLFAAFSRETLVQQDPERALDEMVARLYGEWEASSAAVG